MATRNQGDVCLVVRHANGTAVFGPLFYRHKDPDKNVHDFQRKLTSAGYVIEQKILYQAATLPSFMEACPPLTKEGNGK